MDTLEMVRTKEVFVDVRPPEVYRSGHIPGALNIPLDLLKMSKEKLGDKDVHIAVYCQDGNRSARGVKILRDMGYKNVKDFGPITHWQGDLRSGK